MKYILQSLLLSILIASNFLLLPANAQYGPGGPVYSSWIMVGKLNSPMAVTGTNSYVQLPPAISGTTGRRGLTARICNVGSGDAYLTFGVDNTVLATINTGSWLRSGSCLPYNLQPFAGTSYSYLAAITNGADTASLYVETGMGVPAPMN